MKQIIKAFAKFNLLLNILPKQNDNTKHLLQSIMCLDYMHYDEIIIEEANYFQINYYENNKLLKINNDSITVSLIWLKQLFPDLNFNYKVSVFKHIPIASGLGGESSDSACILNFVLKQNNYLLTEKQKLDLALNVGSDICFFLSQYPQAYVYEYGNKVIKLPSFKINYHLVINNIYCATKTIFNCFDSQPSIIYQDYSYEECLKIIKEQQWSQLSNNLLWSALNSNLDLQLIYETLIKCYPTYHVLLNGSGSSFLLISKSKL